MKKLTIDLTNRVDGKGNRISENDALRDELTNIAALEQVGRADEIPSFEREFVYSDPLVGEALSLENVGPSFDRSIFLIRYLRKRGALLNGRG